MLIKTCSYKGLRSPDRRGDQSRYSNMNQTLVRLAGGAAVQAGTVEERVKSAYFRVTVSFGVTAAAA